MYNREKYILSDSPIKNDLLKLFEKNQRLIIMDIGGCEGEDSIRYARIFPASSIFVFEPLPSNQTILLNNIKKYNVTNLELIPFALSDEEGFQRFHVSSGHPENQNIDLDWDFGNKSSSLLPPDKHMDLVPWIKFEEAITVTTITLNNFLKQRNIKEVDFIHMDVQGAELKVLLGAASCIENIKALWLEVADVTLYKNQPTRSDIENFMKKSGFYLHKTNMNGKIGDQMYLNRKYFETPPLFSLKRIFHFITKQ